MTALCKDGVLKSEKGGGVTQSHNPKPHNHKARRQQALTALLSSYDSKSVLRRLAMKSRLLCAQLLVATVLVEASVTQASFQTGAHKTYSETSSDVVTSMLETNDDDGDGIVQETALSADHYAAVGILDLSESTTIHDS
eukprot:scaffold17432_cov100-Skeletonema_dohrnii-CCMP3373.AAC.1